MSDGPTQETCIFLLESIIHDDLRHIYDTNQANLYDQPGKPGPPLLVPVVRTTHVPPIWYL